ncbi:FAD/NAD(P)-binding oxidoreductase, partial [Burkholderia contaminans]|nr:FAD/NAD(P)-binding oxidoreductase [Burkholderia contaminans]
GTGLRARGAAVGAVGAQGEGFALAFGARFATRERSRGLARADTLLCRCEDVRFDAVAQAPGWTAAKLQSRCGMGACQGRVCGAAAQALFGWTPPVPRTPLVPARVGTLMLDGTASCDGA